MQNSVFPPITTFERGRSNVDPAADRAETKVAMPQGKRRTEDFLARVRIEALSPLFALPDLALATQFGI